MQQPTPTKPHADADAEPKGHSKILVAYVFSKGGVIDPKEEEAAFAPLFGREESEEKKASIKSQS